MTHPAATDRHSRDALRYPSRVAEIIIESRGRHATVSSAALADHRHCRRRCVRRAGAPGAPPISPSGSTDVTAIDPHYHNLTPNNNVAAHLFGYLVQPQ
jgi:hypothetical protein